MHAANISGDSKVILDTRIHFVAYEFIHGLKYPFNY